MARWILIACEILVFLTSANIIIDNFRATRVASKPTAENLDLAAKMDPRDATWHLKLGRIYYYLNISPEGTEKARRQFQTAIALSPQDPETWLARALQLEDEGQSAESDEYLRNAEALAPNSSSIRWVIGNVYLRRNEMPKAFQQFNAVLRLTSRLDQPIFSLGWKVAPNPEYLLEQLIPANLPVEFRFLDYLVSQKHFPDTLPVWNRIIADPDRFQAASCSSYLNGLIGAKLPEQAFGVWADLLRKGVILGEVPGGSTNLITNGDFENEPLNMGFDWRIGQVDGVYVELVQSTYHSPSHALLIQFSGGKNLDFRGVYQYVKVLPKHAYHLQASVTAEALTGDSGPRLEVLDAYDQASLDKFSEEILGTVRSWRTLSLDFTTGANTHLIVVRVVRPPSRPLDTPISGKLWLDDFRLTPLPASEAGMPTR